jgi:hypothetical protein
MGDHDSLIESLIALDTLIKTALVFPRISSVKITRKNNFLVVEHIWFYGKPIDQSRFRSEPGAKVNVAWLFKTVEAIALYHDLIPIFVDSGFNATLICDAARRNSETGDSIFNYVRVNHPSSCASLEFLTDIRRPKFYAPKEIIFEWLSINHSPSQQKRVLLLNRPNSGRKE